MRKGETDLWFPASKLVPGTAPREGNAKCKSRCLDSGSSGSGQQRKVTHCSNSREREPCDGVVFVMGRQGATVGPYIYLAYLRQ